MATVPNPGRSASGNIAETLCLACGLCCDGTLFRDVELQADDATARQAMAALGDTAPPGSRRLPRGKSKWPQPCAALCADLRCQIYADRPSRCRAFDCAMLKSALSGACEVPAALRIIRETRQAADQVRRLLRALGDQAENLPLSRRFRLMRRHCDAGGLADMDESAAEDYAELTLAVHRLQLLLQREFYPRPA
jgi:Fe-S-cluster containining protein